MSFIFGNSTKNPVIKGKMDEDALKFLAQACFLPEDWLKGKSKTTWAQALLSGNLNHLGFIFIFTPLSLYCLTVLLLGILYLFLKEKGLKSIRQTRARNTISNRNFCSDKRVALSESPRDLVTQWKQMKLLASFLRCLFPFCHTVTNKNVWMRGLVNFESGE